MPKSKLLFTFYRLNSPIVYAYVIVTESTVAIITCIYLNGEGEVTVTMSLTEETVVADILVLLGDLGRGGQRQCTLRAYGDIAVSHKIESDILLGVILVA